MDVKIIGNREVYRISLNLKTVGLSKALAVFKNQLGLNWSLLYIYASSRAESGLNILQIENAARTRESGIIYQYEDLMKLLLNLEQLWEIQIVGASNPENLKHYESDEEMWTSCEVIIELFDTGILEIISHQRKPLEEILTQTGS